MPIIPYLERVGLSLFGKSYRKKNGCVKAGVNKCKAQTDSNGGIFGAAKIEQTHRLTDRQTDRQTDNLCFKQLTTL